MGKVHQPSMPFLNRFSYLIWLTDDRRDYDYKPGNASAEIITAEIGLFRMTCSVWLSITDTSPNVRNGPRLFFLTFYNKFWHQVPTIDSDVFHATRPF